jgi:beta-lactamase class A
MSRSLRRLVFLFASVISACAFADASRSLQTLSAADTQFEQELRSLAEPGQIGVAIRDLATGQEFSVNGDQPYSQAGLSKIHVLAALMRASDAGRIDLSAMHTLTAQDKLPGGILHRLGDNSVTMTLRDYATMMVTIDDNSATNILLSRIGVPAVNETLSALDAGDIRFAGLVTDPRNPEDNVASPNALVRCIAALHDGKILSPRSRDEFFSLLSTPRLGSLRSAIPRHIRVASKSGIRGRLRCTAGIVYLKNHPYVIVIMTRPSPAHDETSAENDPATTISAISKLAYTHFAQLTPAEPPHVASTSKSERP